MFHKVLQVFFLYGSMHLVSLTASETEDYNDSADKEYDIYRGNGIASLVY